MTKKQLAQQRNWFKYQLTGLYFNIQQNPQEALTPEEWCYLKNLIDYRNILIEKFDENSKALGLKVKDKKSIIDELKPIQYQINTLEYNLTKRNENN